MQITSSLFKNTEPIPQQFTCDGDNMNPPLSISDIDQNAKSLVLIMDDPDAPGGTWVHWVVWNIRPDTREIAEGSVPEGATQGKTNRAHSYHGPCPPSGVHRYFFKLYALDCMLDVSMETEAYGLVEAMQGHIIDHAELMGTYEKNSANGVWRLRDGQ